MLYSERHRPRGVGLAGAVHRTWAVAGTNDGQFSNPRIDTVWSVYENDCLGVGMWWDGKEAHITRSTLSMKVTGTRPRGRPKMRWLDQLTSDMRIYGINPELVCHGEKRRHHLDGRRRKRLVTVNNNNIGLFYRDHSWLRISGCFTNTIQ